MDDDWASDSGDDLGDLSALPEIPVPEPPAKPAPPPLAVPPVNAWTSPNQSGDVRAAVRTRPPVSSPARPAGRRDHFPFNTPTTPTDRSARPNGSARGITLYVSNLPFETNEAQIAAFFSAAGVDPAAVHLSRHADTGNIKAAFVTLQPDTSPQLALSLNGRQLGSRSLHIKIEGSDRDRRSANRDYNHARDRDRDRSSHTPSYSGSFGGRERRAAEDAPNAWGSTSWNDRSSAAASKNFESTSERRDRANDSRDAKIPSTRTDAQQPQDPTIPTGPPTPGRKKLQLKPRTKPPPVIEVDRRTVDAPNQPKSAPVIMQKQTSSERPTFRASTAPKKQIDKDGEWTNARESGIARSPAVNHSSSKKEDSSKRPVLLNAFAALGVDDTEL